MNAMDKVYGKVENKGKESAKPKYCWNCGEKIDVDADNMLKRARDIYCFDCNSNGGAACRACETGRTIDLIETEEEVDPVKHGHWEQHPTDKEWDVCSCCGAEVRRREYIGLHIITYQCDYCPRCGAKLDEPVTDGE